VEGGGDAAGDAPAGRERPEVSHPALGGTGAAAGQAGGRNPGRPREQ